MVKQIIVWGLVVAFGLLWMTRRGSRRGRSNR